MKKQNKAALAIASIMSAGNAAAYDWSTVTAGIDFSGEQIAIAAVITILAGVFVVRKGGRLVLGLLK